MVSPPAATPVITPSTGSMVAKAVLLLLHTPVRESSESVIDELTHTFDGPVITSTTGNELTVSGVVTIDVQPKPSVYV